MRLIVLILLLCTLSFPGGAEPLSIGVGISIPEGAGRVGPAAVADFILLNAGGFISLNAGGKMQCNAC